MSERPRAGQGNELYLFPTITVPPTYASNEYGLEPGIPTPADANRTDEHLGISGTLKEGSESLLPITITVDGNAALKQGIQAQIDRALTGGSTTSITDIIRQVRRRSTAPGGGAAVPRFAVTRAVDPNIPEVVAPFGIAPDFDGVPFGSQVLSPPSGYINTSTDNHGQSAAMCLDYRGRLTCSYLITRSSGGDANKHRILTYLYDQAVDTQWRAAVTVTEWESPSAQWVLNNGAALNTPHIATVLYRGDIYAIVSDAGNIGAEVRGSILVYRLVQDAIDPPWSWKMVGSPVKMSTALGVIANGGISAAALPDRVVVAVGAYSGTDILFREETRSVWIGQSADMETWSNTDDNSSGFIALDAYRPILPVESNGTRFSQRVNRVHMYCDRPSGDALYGVDGGDNLNGWAVTDGGRIYRTTDGGLTWAQQVSPVKVPLYDVQAVAGSGESIVVYACGAKGCVLKTTDSGTTWKIVSISMSEGQSIDIEEFTRQDGKNRQPIGDGPLYGMAWVGEQYGWVVGQDKIAYTANGSHTWAKVEPRETRATYTSVAVLDAATSTILVGGAIERQRTKSSPLAADLKRYRFVKITTATDTGGYNLGEYAFHDTTESDAYRIERLFIRSAAEGYACGRKGTLLKSTNLNTSTPTWTALTTPGDRDYLDIQWRMGASGDGRNEFILAASDGTVLRSVTSGNDWVPQHIGTETVGTSVAVVSYSITSDDESIILAAGGTDLWRTDVSMQFESLPALLPLSTGELLLATANLQDGRIDLRRSTNGGMTWGVVDLSESEVVKFAAQTTYTTIDSPTLRPCLYRTDAGELHLTAGAGGVVAPDGTGATWLARTSRELTLPLGALTIANAATQNRSRITIPYGGGRLFTVSLNASGNYETRTAREWTASSDLFNPVVPATAQWIGVDDVRVTFPSTNIPSGEAWTINAEYRFPARHLITDTRSQFWRGDDLTFLNPPAIFEWDRQHADVLAQLGAGRQWNVTACALFGTNFRQAILRISNPEYSGSSFPTSASDYTEFRMFADVDQGIVAAPTDGSASGTPFDVLKIAGKQWVPSQWRPGARSYYAEVTDGTNILAYRILDNTPDCLILARSENAFPITAGETCIIVGDRMFCDGSAGTQGAVQNRPPLIGSLYEFGRFVRLIIPNQTPPDAYWKIEGICIGRHVPVAITVPEGTYQRDRFDREVRWRPTVSQVEEESLQGEVAVETFGRMRQAWEFRYSSTLWFDRDATLAPMLSRLRQPFALVMDDADPVGTVEWCRLDSQLPDVVHGGGDLWSYQLTLLEV